MKDIEDKLAALLMDYGVLKNADADKMAIQTSIGDTDKLKPRGSLE